MENNLEYARRLDQQDPLFSFREKFYIPQHKGQPVIYLCGNSLGLQPRATREIIEQELLKWQLYGVEGHFTGEPQWFDYRKSLKPMLSKIVGASEQEITIMNNLTTNLHLLLVSFYRPEGKRTKILMEAAAFPSDQYAIETQVRFHGLDPDKEIIELSPKTGEHTLNTEDILAAIEQFGDELALVMMGGINYYTGQAFEMQKITQKAHAVGAMAGFDLAHAIGNIHLDLHNWDVDFAVWCSYKYLNGSPGTVGGAFVHEAHAHQFDLPRFGGWWGHNEQERFQMKKGFKPIQGADGWQLANEPILLMAALKASLEIFEEAGLERLLAKSRQLTTYLEFILKENLIVKYQVITPRNQRGCQLSLLVENKGKALFEYLQKNGVIVDWREPNVIRMAPVPLYNSFEDIYKTGTILNDFI